MIQYVLMMLKNNLKRSVSLILVLTILFSLAPLGNATEEQEDPAVQNTEPVTIVESNPESASTETTEPAAAEVTEEETLSNQQISKLDMPEQQGELTGLSDDGITIVHNGSRLMLTGADSCQWQRSDDDVTYVDIADATGAYYDLTAADSYQYIRAKLGEDTFTAPVQITGQVVIFDLANAVVELDVIYSGKDADNNPISGTHAAGNIYIIRQSNNGTFTTNNINVKGNHANAPFDITLDGVHIGIAKPVKKKPEDSGIGSYNTGAIDLVNDSTGKREVVLRLKGENIVRAIHFSTDTNAASSLKITNINGDGTVDGGKLYVPLKKETDEEIQAFIDSDLAYNHWNSGIGGDDGSYDNVANLEIAGGFVQVLTNYGDNCTAIGAGGNGPCTMTISGGKVVAHCNGTGAAIGGGIGWHSGGGTCDVTITGGEVYAKNHGYIERNVDGIPSIVGGVAIGAGSSFAADGRKGIVKITGGTVEAYGAFGNGIGGGNSSNATGGSAEITISGGTVTANSIGGGDSKNGAGGEATVNISSDAYVTLNKGEYESSGIGGGNSLSGNGGSATITVAGGTLVADGSIGGGAGGGNGNGGDAEVTVKGGTLKALSIGGGVGGVGGNGGPAIIEISGGTIETGSIGGGSTLNTTDGKLGYATANITGGDISGQFLLMAGGTEPCRFNMEGGTLHGVDTSKEEPYDYTMDDGAAVYMDDPNGIVTISGGTIEDCSAVNGGAVYMTAGTFTMSGSAVITGCTATGNGGAVYLGSSGENKSRFTMEGGVISDNHADNGNGGAIYLNGGDAYIADGVIGQLKTVDGEGNPVTTGLPNTAQNGGGAYLAGGKLTVSGGAISGNTADGNGGGAYVNGGDLEAYGSAKISGNTAAQNGGGAYVNGGAVLVYGNAQVSGNIAGTNGGGITVNNGNFTMDGGNVDNNHAVGGSGGGIYVSSNSANMVNVSVFSGSVSDNEAGNSGGALAVKGEEGKPITVTVGINEDHFTDQGFPEHGSHGACTCPVINHNTSQTTGGAVLVTGSKEAKLYLYCLTETGNTAADPSKPSDFMMVEGGTVEITTEQPGTQSDEQTGKHGNTTIRNTIYVVGGDMDIWGTMTNPDISDVITVDIQNGLVDEFDDHRIVTAGNKEFYKLLYFENFTDPATGATTGRYKQIPVEKGQTVTIDGFVYSHTGYEINGWNTDRNNAVTTFATHNPEELQPGEVFINEGWYSCKEDYLFDGTNRNHLNLFAIWNPIGYVIMFDPNVGENGKYTGQMYEMGLKYDEKKPLSENQFGRPGFVFDKWNTEPDGSGDSYADKELVVNLSNEVGKPVTLYAQWIPCDHDPDAHPYTYTVKENVLTGECDCTGCTVTATLKVSDVTYDQAIHKADLEISISAPVEDAVEVKLRNYTVKYEMFTPPAEGESEGVWSQMDAGKHPVNAGQYRASITAPDGQQAVKAYTIRKKNQPAPSKPSYKTVKDDPTISIGELIIDEVTPSSLKDTDVSNVETGKTGYDGQVEYAIIYDLGDGTQAEPVWQTSREFTLDEALTSYYVLVRYSECTNYKASDISKADSKYFFAGNVRITVHGIDGINDTLKEASKDDMDVVTGVKLSLALQDGYYFPGTYDIRQIVVVPAENGANLSVSPVTAEETDSKRVFSITGIKRDSEIEIFLSPVKKLPTVQSYVTEGQVFADFTDTQAIISRDSAYTAKFVVENFDKAVYTGAFAFENLPEGTPLILMKKSSGTTTYYRATGAASVPLRSFVEMGTQATEFSLGADEQSVTLQLVAALSGAAPSNSVNTTLVLTHDENVQPNASDVSGGVATTLRDQAAFATSVEAGSVTLQYTPSEGVASVWNGRDNALVIKPKAGTVLPNDAKLKYTIGKFNHDCFMNPEGAFVIPLGALQSDRVTLNFTLLTMMQTGTYELEAQWYVGRSLADTAPLNGELVGTESITLSSVKSNVSLETTCDKHLYTADETVTASIRVKDAEGYTTKLDIQRKIDGEYQSINVAKTITGDCTQTFGPNLEPGSYRLHLYAYTSYTREETSFYFIVQ